MPGIGGRFGWNEPPPAAVMVIFVSNTLPASVVIRDSRSPTFSTFSTLSFQVNVRGDRLVFALRALLSALARNLMIVCMGDCLAAKMGRGKHKCTHLSGSSSNVSNVQ